MKPWLIASAWLLSVVVLALLKSFAGVTTFAIFGAFWIWAAFDAQKQHGKTLVYWQQMLDRYKAEADSGKPE